MKLLEKTLPFKLPLDVPWIAVVHCPSARFRRDNPVELAIEQQLESSAIERQLGGDTCLSSNSGNVLDRAPAAVPALARSELVVTYFIPSQLVSSFELKTSRRLQLALNLRFRMKPTFIQNTLQQDHFKNKLQKLN